VRKSRKALALAAIAVGSLAVAVSAFGSSNATTVAVTAGKPTEFRFTLSKKTILKGTGVFKVTNKGKINHDFKIAGKKTPTVTAGKVSTLRVLFKKAGKYPYLCTLPGHAALGMKGVLTVK